MAVILIVVTELGSANGTPCIVPPIKTGRYTTVKLPDDVALPYDVVTEIAPLNVPLGTVTVSEVSDAPVTTAGVSPILTAVYALKLVPVMVTTVPGAPEFGEKPLIVGLLLFTLKLPVYTLGPHTS